jgi:hypothetical protein
VCQTVASSPQLLGTPVDPRAAGVNFAVDPDQTLLSNNGTFSWLGAPTGSGYTSVEYACGTTPGDAAFAPIDGVTQCHVDASLLDNPYLTVRVGANGTFYESTYRAF